MEQYHKIKTVYLRDPENNYKTLLDGVFARPEFALLADCQWRWDEKIDGTNIRVIWDGENVRFGGMTDRAQIPPFLLDRLQGLFPAEKISEVATGPITLYGEGFGARIQKGGGNYIPDGVDFVLFDAFAGGVWLERSSVQGIAEKLGCRMIPEIAVGNLYEAVEFVREGFDSQFGKARSEGLVMRPHVDLLDRRGQRVITKIKHRDFIGG